MEAGLSNSNYLAWEALMDNCPGIYPSDGPSTIGTEKPSLSHNSSPFILGKTFQEAEIIAQCA